MTKPNRRVERTEISIKDFLNYQPSLNQLFDGKIQVQEARVVAIMGNVPAALSMSEHPITLDGSRNKIISGHHRLEATKRDLKDGKVSEDFVFPVTIEFGLSLAEFSSKVYAANNDTASGNHSTHAVFSKTEASVKIINPIFQAIKQAHTKFPLARGMALARKLGQVFNENPILVNNLKDEKFLDIKDSDFYYAKKGVAGKNFHRSEVNVDLRPYVNQLSNLVEVYVIARTELTLEGIWKEKLGNSTNFDYVLIAACIRGELGEKGQLTPKKLRTVLSNNGNKIKKYSKLYQDAPERYSDSIRTLLNVE